MSYRTDIFSDSDGNPLGAPSEYPACSICGHEYHALNARVTLDDSEDEPRGICESCAMVQVGRIDLITEDDAYAAYLDRQRTYFAAGRTVTA